jgi:hypothetical protein
MRGDWYKLALTRWEAVFEFSLTPDLSQWERGDGYSVPL